MTCRHMTRICTVCLVVEGEARQLCPVDQGHLRASITSETEITADEIIGRIGSNLEYAPYVHNGTGIWKVIANNSYKIGNAIHLNMEIYTTSIIVANNVYNNAFTIPSQYRPLIDTAVNVTASDGAYKNPVACTSLAKANGNLFFCIPKATNNYLFIDAEWECA